MAQEYFDACPVDDPDCKGSGFCKHTVPVNCVHATCRQVQTYSRGTRYICCVCNQDVTEFVKSELEQLRRARA